jgi:hypothetical protein
MKSVRLAVGATIGAAAVLVAGAPSASAEGTGPSVAFAGHLVAGPGATTVRITYTCNDGPGAFDHLFVAVKQGPQVDTDAHSSSQYADTFYSTNWKSDAGPNALNCDGVQHTQMIVLKPQPGFTPRVPRLHTGPALVQLCLFDNVTAVGDEGPLDGGFAPSYTMEQVHAGKGAR